MSGQSSFDPTAIPNCTDDVGEPASICNQMFTHKIKLVPVNGKSVELKGVPWSFNFDEEKYNEKGNSDTNGETVRVETPNPKKFFALVGKLAEGYRRRENNFGSLDKTEVDERKISLMTATKYPLKEVPYCSGYDYITVVAARTIPWSTNVTTLFRDGPGNQYRFINCGIRQLGEFPDADDKNYTIQRIMVVFQHGYTTSDIERINEYTACKNARIIYVKNKDEFVNFLNKRKALKRLIKKMVFFCHGIINIASFHYSADHEDDEKSGEFDISYIEKVHESIFDYDAEVITYACRAGISVDEHDFSGGKYAGQMESHAQKMADKWDVNVKAFEMRSLYEGVYGTKEELAQVEKERKIVEEYQTELARYKMGKLTGDNRAPKPKKPDGYDEMERRVNEVRERESNATDGGGPIAPNGSWCFPTTASTPTGLRRGLLPYKPSEWKMS